MRRPSRIIENLKMGQLDCRDHKDQETLFKYIKELEIYKYKYDKLSEVVAGLEKNQDDKKN